MLVPTLKETTWQHPEVLDGIDRSRESGFDGQRKQNSPAGAVLA
jgi:hypothetical protein